MLPLRHATSAPLTLYAVRLYGICNEAHTAHVVASSTLPVLTARPSGQSGSSSVRRPQRRPQAVWLKLQLRQIGLLSQLCTLPKQTLSLLQVPRAVSTDGQCGRKSGATCDRKQPAGRERASALNRQTTISVIAKYLTKPQPYHKEFLLAADERRQDNSAMKFKE